MTEHGRTFVVTDNGTGIARAFHERIFGLFNRPNPAQSPGSGVGLAICNQVVERHGGGSERNRRKAVARSAASLGPWSVGGER